MKRPSRPPLLLLDVDGVLSLFGFPATALPDGEWIAVEGIPHRIATGAGPLLTALAERFECVWCTGWEEKAEEHLPHLLGLPGGWRHVDLGRHGGGDRHWKLDAIDCHAGPTRPLAWVDDAHDASCVAWARERAGPTLLVATDPARGLTAAHVQRLLDWATAVAQGAAAPPAQAGGGSGAG